MPLTTEQLESIRGALGEDGAETFKAISEAVTAAKTQIDTLKGEATAAKRAQTKADKALEQAQADLKAATGETSEQLEKLIAERDAAKAAAETAQAEFRSHRIQSAVAEKLGISDAKRRKAALKLFELPEGVDFDESGALTGADSAIEAFKAEHDYLFVDTQSANTAGGRKGQQPAGNRGGNAPKTHNDKVAAWGSLLKLPSFQEQA